MAITVSPRESPQNPPFLLKMYLKCITQAIEKWVSFDEKQFPQAPIFQIFNRSNRSLGPSLCWGFGRTPETLAGELRFTSWRVFMPSHLCGRLERGELLKSSWFGFQSLLSTGSFTLPVLSFFIIPLTSLTPALWNCHLLKQTLADCQGFLGAECDSSPHLPSTFHPVGPQQCFSAWLVFPGKAVVN